MDLKEELALAILVWRFAKMKLKKYGASNWVPTADSITVTDFSLEMAKSVGLKDEYLKLLFDHPVLTIDIKEVEKYVSREGATHSRRGKRAAGFVKKRGRKGKEGAA